MKAPIRLLVLGLLFLSSCSDSIVAPLVVDRILHTGKNSTPGSTSTYWIRPDGSNRLEVVDGAIVRCVSEDHRKMVYQRRDTRKLYLSSIDGSGAMELTTVDNGGNHEHVDVGLSFDGSMMVQSTDSMIHISSVDGSNRKTIPIGVRPATCSPTSASGDACVRIEVADDIGFDQRGEAMKRVEVER